MTTLAAAASIGDTHLTIDAPMAAGQVPGWVKIDSELLKVGGEHRRTGTTLALSNPVSANHSNGATVTYAGNPFDADFLAATGGGGAEQTISKIGPFRFNFNETDNFKELAALDQGVIVMLAWPEIITPFGSGPDANIELYAGPIAGTWLLIGQWFADSGAQTTVDVGGAPNVLGTTVAHLQGGMSRPARIKTAGNSLVAVLNPSAPNTAGAADIYALIAEPV